MKNTTWSYQTALTVPEAQMQLSSTFFSKYGLTKKIEIESKPIFFYKIPNLNLKINWLYIPPKANKQFYKRIGYAIGSLHGIYYPSPLMRYIAKKNILGLSFNNGQIPNSLIFRNELLFSIIDDYKKGCSRKRSLYTIYLGVAFPLNKNNDINPLEKKNAYWYRKTSVFENPIWYLGFNYTSSFPYGLHYAIDIGFYSIGINTNSFTIEHKTLFYILWLTHLRVAAGYKTAFSNEVNIKAALYPVFDATIIFFTKKYKREKKPKNSYISSDEMLKYLKEKGLIESNQEQNKRK